jgi:tol-pal system protein YbgF
MWRQWILVLIVFCLIGSMGCATSKRKGVVEEEPWYPVTQELKQDIARLESTLEELNGETAELNKRTNNLDNRISLLGQEMKGKPEYTSPSTAMTPAQPASGDVQAIYNTALDEYYARKFDRAIQKFVQIISGHPRSTLADNSQYWLAECYYGLEDFPRAIEEFRKVFSYADTEKDDDAQLKLGFCYTNLGDTTQAVAEFRKLLNLYPDSEFADVARRKIEELSP